MKREFFTIFVALFTVMFIGNNVFAEDSTTDVGDTSSTTEVTAGPTEEAPAPNYDAEKVISVYSDSYTTGVVRTTSSYFFVPEYATVEGNEYAIMEFSSSATQSAFVIEKQDLTSMEYLQFSYWVDDDYVGKTITPSLLSYKENGTTSNPSNSYTVTTEGDGWHTVTIPLTHYSEGTTDFILDYIWGVKFYRGTADLIYIDDVIFFTTSDGSTPTTESSVYSEAITIEKTRTVKAFVVCEGVSSVISEIKYTYVDEAGNEIFTAPDAPVFSVTEASFFDDFELIMTSDAPIYYTLNGTEPTAESTLYEAPISINQTMTVRAIAISEDGISSKETKVEYKKTLKEFDYAKVTEAKGDYSGEYILVAEENDKYYVLTNTASSGYITAYATDALANDENLADYVVTVATVDGSIYYNLVNKDSKWLYWYSAYVYLTTTDYDTADLWDLSELGFIKTTDSTVRYLYKYSNTQLGITSNDGSTPVCLYERVDTEKVLSIYPDAPTFSVDACTINGLLKVELDAADDMTIYYTVDGSEPALGENNEPTGTTQKYTEALEISATTTVRAISFNNTTEVVSETYSEVTYTFVLLAPTFDVEETEFAPAFDLEISAIDGATIYYTLESDSTTLTSTDDRKFVKYDSLALTSISATTAVIAYATYGENDEYVSANDTIIYEFLPMPTFAIADTVFYNNFELEILAVEGANIYFTVDGSVPEIGNAKTYLYSADDKYTVSNTTPIAAIAEYNGSTTEAIQITYEKWNAAGGGYQLVTEARADYSGKYIIASYYNGEYQVYGNTGTFPGCTYTDYGRYFSVADIGACTKRYTDYEVTAEQQANGTWYRFTQAAVTSADLPMYLWTTSGTTTYNLKAANNTNASLENDVSAYGHLFWIPTVTDNGVAIYSAHSDKTAWSIKMYATSSGYEQYTDEAPDRTASSHLRVTSSTSYCTQAYLYEFEEPSEGSLADYVVEVPVFSADEAIFVGSYTFSLSADLGQTIYYTTDGTTPELDVDGNPTGTTTLYDGEVVINATTTVNAIAVAYNGVASEEATATYTYYLPVATPTFTITETQFTESIELGITCTSEDAIYFTIDETAPTTDSYLYSAEDKITISRTTTVKAVAVRDGDYSDVATIKYTKYATEKGYQKVTEVPTGDTGSYIVAANADDLYEVLAYSAKASSFYYGYYVTCSDIETVGKYDYEFTVSKLENGNYAIQQASFTCDNVDYNNYYLYASSLTSSYLRAATEYDATDAKYDWSFSKTDDGVVVVNQYNNAHIAYYKNSETTTTDAQSEPYGTGSNKIVVSGESITTSGSFTSAYLYSYAEVEVEADYVVEEPVFSSVGDMFVASFALTLTAELGDDIYYSIDGDENYSLYESPITISETTTVKAYAKAYNNEVSEEVSYTYTYLAAPTFTKEGGEFVEEFTLTLTANAGATIYYTVDGTTEPTTASSVYGSGITISETTTVRAIAVYNDFVSIEASYTFTKVESLAVETPTFTITETQFTESFELAISCATADAVIYFSIDEIDPVVGNSNTHQYSDDAKITISKTTTVKAIAVLDGETSYVTEIKYVRYNTLDGGYQKVTDSREDFSGDYIVAAYYNDAYQVFAGTDNDAFGSSWSGAYITYDDLTSVSAQLSDYEITVHSESSNYSITQAYNDYYLVYQSSYGLRADDTNSSTSTSYRWTFSTTDGGTLVNNVNASTKYITLMCSGTFVNKYEEPYYGGTSGCYRTYTIGGNYTAAYLYEYVAGGTVLADYVVEEPVFSYEKEVFTAAFDLTLTAEFGDTIYYSIDGADYVEYTSPIAINANTTVKAYAKAYNNTVSETATYTYTYLAAPTFTTEGGNFTDALTLTLSALDGATIYYTVTETAPDTTASLVYSSPISIAKTTTVRAIAVYDGVVSDEKSYTFTLVDETGATLPYVADVPTFSTDATAFKESFDLMLTAEEGASIYYTLNNTEATAASGTPYTGAITIDETTTVRAIAVTYNGYTSEEAVRTFTYINKPTFSNEVVEFEQEFDLTLTSEGATIYYTLDGEDPTTSSDEYTAPITISKSTTVKAIAVIDGVQSDVAEMTYVAYITLGNGYEKVTTALTDYTGDYILVAEYDSKYYVFTGEVSSYLGVTAEYTDLTNVIELSEYEASVAKYSGTTETLAGTYTIETTEGVYMRAPNLYYLTVSTIIADQSCWNFATAYSGTTYSAYSSTDSYYLVMNTDTKNITLTTAASDNYVAAYWWKSSAIVAPESVATPTITESANFSSSILVTMSCATDNTVIYYTTNGDEPDNTSYLYEGAITIDATTTVKAIAYAGPVKSDVVSETYTQKEVTVDVDNTQVSYSVYSTGGNVYVETEAGAAVQAYSISGQLVFSSQATASTVTEIAGQNNQTMIVVVNGNAVKVVVR